MDRQIVYPGGIPLDTDFLSMQRNQMINAGFLAQMILGTSPTVDGLACTQTTVPSMAVLVGPGSMLALSTVDATAYGSLAADTADALIKLGVNLTSTTLSVAAPTTSGQSINYLIEAAFQESDTGSTVLPYYNATTPSAPYSGPGNAGTSQNTQRIQRVGLVAKAGTPAATGSQTTPAVDSGYTALYVVTVAYGATSVVNSNISVVATAPFVQWKLPTLAPGYSRMVPFITSSSFLVPAGVYRVKITAVGGGGGGGGCSAGQGAGGGGAGATSIVENLAVTPGQSISIVIGAGGAGGSSGGGAGGTGGTSSASYGGSTVAQATGGQGGTGSTSANAAGGGPGSATYGTYNFSGGYGGDGQTVTGGSVGGYGCASSQGGGGRGSAGGSTPSNAQAAGSGGGGAYQVAGQGGAGSNGVVIVEY